MRLLFVYLQLHEIIRKCPTSPCTAKDKPVLILGPVCSSTALRTYS